MPPQGMLALISERPHRGSRPLRRAAWALLLPAALGLSVALSGCAGIATGNTEMPLTGLDPSYREAVAAHLKSVVKNYNSYDFIRDLRSALGSFDQGPAWLTCVRFHDKGRVRNYALFLDGNRTIVDDRFAVRTDDCDLQTYYPFDRMPTGLNPLH